jgi:deoxyribose-phosphate aldolase
MLVNDILEVSQQITKEYHELREAGKSIPRRTHFDVRSLSAPAFAALIDHTILRPDASDLEIDRVCSEGIQFGVASVCVSPSALSRCAKTLRGSEVKPCTVIGFPHGVTSTAAKVHEAMQAIGDGAAELDMVLHPGKLKSRDLEYVQYDIQQVCLLAHNHGNLVKVILETCRLTEEEIVMTCLIARNAGADFVKTSTGFGSSGATVDAVSLMRHTVGLDLGVKASGGIKNYDQALALVMAGADRLGTSSTAAILSGIPHP